MQGALLPTTVRLSQQQKDRHSSTPLQAFAREGEGKEGARRGAETAQGTGSENK